MPIRWKKIEIRDFLDQHYPGVDLDHKLVKDVLYYFDNEILSVSVAKKSFRIEEGENITAENCTRALAAMYDAGLINVKEYVDTAYEWKKVLKQKEKDK
jgi:hypothetical protein